MRSNGVPTYAVGWGWVGGWCSACQDNCEIYSGMRTDKGEERERGIKSTPRPSQTDTWLLCLCGGRDGKSRGDERGRKRRGRRGRRGTEEKKRGEEEEKWRRGGVGGE